MFLASFSFCINLFRCRDERECGVVIEISGDLIILARTTFGSFVGSKLLLKKIVKFLYLSLVEDCIFCKIVRGDAPANKVWEDKDILAFWDIKPSAPVHILIIPKKHLENVSEAREGDRDLLGKIQLTAVKIAQKLNIADGFRISTLNGKKAGQIVFHLHYHLQGGWRDKEDDQG